MNEEFPPSILRPKHALTTCELLRNMPNLTFFHHTNAKYASEIGWSRNGPRRC